MLGNRGYTRRQFSVTPNSSPQVWNNAVSLCSEMAEESAISALCKIRVNDKSTLSIIDEILKFGKRNIAFYGNWTEHEDNNEHKYRLVQASLQIL